MVIVVPFAVAETNRGTALSPALPARRLAKFGSALPEPSSSTGPLVGWSKRTVSRSSAVTADSSAAVTVLPEMATEEPVPRMVRIDPVFVAVTVNALPAGLDVVFSALSKVTVSVLPSTFAPTTRDGSTVTVTVSVVRTSVASPSVSENVRSVELLTEGAVNAGVAEVASSSVTAGPAVCVHA